MRSRIPGRWGRVRRVGAGKCPGRRNQGCDYQPPRPFRPAGLKVISRRNTVNFGRALLCEYVGIPDTTNHRQGRGRGLTGCHISGPTRMAGRLADFRQPGMGRACYLSPPACHHHPPCSKPRTSPTASDSQEFSSCPSKTPVSVFRPLGPTTSRVLLGNKTLPKRLASIQEHTFDGP